MSVNRIEPPDAAQYLAEGWIYLDVRTVGEFDQGHPEGAFNIPFLLKGPMGMAANPDFLAVVTHAFQPTDKLVLGCRSGNRSNKAAVLLLENGYQEVVDMRGGYHGERGPNGALTCEGWANRDLPIASSPQAGRDYNSLKGAACP